MDGTAATERNGKRKTPPGLSPESNKKKKKKRSYRTEMLFTMFPEKYEWHDRALVAIQRGCNVWSGEHSTSFASILLRHMLEFLQCCVYFPDSDLWPPRAVDEAWCGLLMDTGLYSSMCAWVGNSLHPPVTNAFVHRIPEDDRREERVALFLKSYRELYAREFPRCLLGYEIAGGTA